MAAGNRPTASIGGAGTKSPQAFRTIAEVANDLELPQHVLRFWETKFPQVQPLKRRGGRRYYRPEDIVLLRRIRGFLYNDGYTIRGVQKLLREGSRPGNGVRAKHSAETSDHVAPSNPVRSDAGTAKELKALLRELEEIQALLLSARE
ncbi:MAG: MerR family transcriptional regulator [Hyphomicrobiales bacterium]|nr:MerR family transcriptional regulator [Hyphomicrobiales bacterium]